MRILYLFAALLALFSLGLHYMVIGPEQFDPMMLAADKVSSKAMLGVLWHAVGAVLLVCFLALGWAVYAGNPAARPVGVMAGAILTGLALLYLAAGLNWHNDVAALPYWPILLPAGVFALIAAF